MSDLLTLHMLPSFWHNPDFLYDMSGIGKAAPSMLNLSLRVAWHDNRWNSSVRRSLNGNAFCSSLDRIRQEKEPASEEPFCGRCFSTLKPHELPPCKAEFEAFMNEKESLRIFQHPFEVPVCCRAHSLSPNFRADERRKDEFLGSRVSLTQDILLRCEYFVTAQ